MNSKQLAKIIEGVAFVSGDGIEKSEFKNKYEASDKQINEALDILKSKYSTDSGINIIEYKSKIQLCSNPDLAEDIADILNPIREKVLSKSVLETVAIIAYKQPITRLEIEGIRQVHNSDYTMQLLLKNDLIEVVGRKDTVGKPLLYGTTENFLKRFQIKDLNELPKYDELLARIRVINTDKQSLFRDYDVPSDVISLDENELVREREDFDSKFANYKDIIADSQNISRSIKKTIDQADQVLNPNKDADVDGEEPAV